MSVQFLAKGPLSSALGQWLFVGCGACYVFVGDSGVGNAAREIAAMAFRLATGKDGLTTELLQEAALHNTNNLASPMNSNSRPMQPIIIHSNASDSGKGWTAALLRVSVGAGACWVSYVALSGLLPDHLKELLPVTRRYFEAAVTSLGQGVLHIKEVLGQQIEALGIKQDAMAAKQEETHDEVRGLRDDVGDVQRHIDDIAAAISRCEGALGDAEGRQTYTSLGVGLLVRCVGDLLRANDPAVAEELDRFQRSAKLLDRGSDADGGEGAPAHHVHKRRHMECDLSEIGSTASTAAVDDRSPTCQDRKVTPLRTQSSSLLGLSSPPGTLHLHPFRGHGGRSDGGRHKGGDAASAKINHGNSSSLASSVSSPEDEVPRLNYAMSDVLKDVDVDELLRIVKSGGMGSVKA